MYDRLAQLAIHEGNEPDDSLPDPETLPMNVDEMGMLYELWLLWSATEKRYLPSQLIPEILSGHGRLLSGMMEMETLFMKTKAQIKKQKPNG